MNEFISSMFQFAVVWSIRLSSLAWLEKLISESVIDWSFSLYKPIKDFEIACSSV